MPNLYLIPTTLGETNISDVIPEKTQEICKELRVFIVENIKTARRYLRKIDKSFPIDDSIFFTLNKHTTEIELSNFLNSINSNDSIGMISEAGCPGIADPGAEVAKLAHKKGWKTIPMVGPSSIFLALMSSGFSGQNFSFHGYIPKERPERRRFLQKLEKKVDQTGSSEIFMETPFRNVHLFEDIITSLKPSTSLCIASNISCHDEMIKTKEIKDWKKKCPNINKIPTIFILGR